MCLDIGGEVELVLIEVDERGYCTNQQRMAGPACGKRNCTIGIHIVWYLGGLAGPNMRRGDRVENDLRSQETCGKEHLPARQTYPMYRIVELLDCRRMECGEKED